MKRIGILEVLSLGITVIGVVMGIAEYNSNKAERAAWKNKPMDLLTSTNPQQAHLLQAYPSALTRFHGNELVWADGTRMIWDDGLDKTGDSLLDHPDLEDIFELEYPVDTVIFKEDFDPGRCRPEAFFKKLYGETAEEVEANLVDVGWLDGVVRFNQKQGAASALRRVEADLRTLPQYYNFLKPSAGTFNWRTVEGTDRLSNHSFGIAIDLNVDHAHYWRWSKEFRAGKPLKYQNSIPMEIVKIFERHGFIWGGKWYHYDTMHFEYRPELCWRCQNS